MSPRCICGCGQRAAHRHHAVTCQELRKIPRRRGTANPLTDKRNLVWMAFDCHNAHHGRSRVLPLTVLPDSVFVFAEIMLGAGRAYNYLRRHYAGNDRRLDALLTDAGRIPAQPGGSHDR